MTVHIDAIAGDLLERTVEARHRRRLRRLGRAEALAPEGPDLWAQAPAPPPRAGCSLEVLIDGASALPAMAEAIRSARESVHICTWHLQPGFVADRSRPRETMRELLAGAAEQVPVRVIQWAGAPLPVFSPRRGAVRSERAALLRGTRIQHVLDARGRQLHCHHEKLVVVDGRIAFVGGIDFTALAGDRFDAPGHPDAALGRMGWHDVATRLGGPVVHDVAAHFALRWQALTGAAPALPATDAAGGAQTAALPLRGADRPAAVTVTGGDAVEVQLVRTVPDRTYRALPRGEFSVLEAYLRALRSARRLVYLENQFLWSPEIGAVLEDKLRDPPSPDFRVVVVLPRHPTSGGDDTRGQLGLLLAADEAGGGGRLLAVTLRRRTASPAAPPAVYVHAKVGIVDDRWLAVGSANLNEHSLFNDTEVDVVTCDAALARATRLRLWAEHLERREDEVAGPPAAVVDGLWRPIASDQLARERRAEPPTHHLVELTGISRRAARLRGPLDALVVDG